MKINVVKVANIAGMALGIAGTLLTSWAGQKTAKETIVKEVAKTFADRAKRH